MEKSVPRFHNPPFGDFLFLYALYLGCVTIFDYLVLIPKWVYSLFLKIMFS